MQAGTGPLWRVAVVVLCCAGALLALDLWEEQRAAALSAQQRLQNGLEQRLQAVLEQRLQQALEQRLRLQHKQEQQLHRELERLRGEQEQQVRRELEQQLRRELEQQLRRELEQQLRRELEQQLRKQLAVQQQQRCSPPAQEVSWLDITGGKAQAAAAAAAVAAAPLLQCAADTWHPCTGNKTIASAVAALSGPARDTLSAIKGYWGTVNAGGWAQHLSSHWDIATFERCAPPPAAPRTGAAAARGVVFTIVRGGIGNFERQLAAMRTWARNLFAVMRAPVIIFTQEEASAAYREQMQALFNATGGVTFLRVQLAKDRLAHVRPTPSHKSPFPKLGWMSAQYAQMCQFLAYDAYQHPAFDDFTHFLRLDADAEFRQPVPYDLFAEVASGGFLTAYSMLGMPEVWHNKMHSAMSRTLLEPVLTDLLRRGVLPPPDVAAVGEQGLADTLWSGPLQLSALSLYRSPEFYAFAEAVDVWKLMAGDVREQALNTLWLKLAVPRSKALWLCDLDMKHKLGFPARCKRVQC